VEKSRKSKRASKDWSKDQDFAAFRAAYPKPDRAPARTHAAWIKALKIASPAEVMAGLAVHPFNPDEKYRPDPATWLNGQSWRASAAQSTPVPASVPKPIKTTSGVVLSDEDLFQVPT
jgi:hypothetical protein